MTDFKVLDPTSMANLRSDVVAAKAEEGKNSKLDAEKNLLNKQKEERLTQKEKRLQNPKAAAPPTPRNGKGVTSAADEHAAAVARAADEEDQAIETEMKQRALDKITMYREKFKQLKKRNTVGAKSSLDELTDEVHYIEMQLGSANETGGDNPACMGLIAGMTGLEYVVDQHWNPLNLQLSGLGQTTRDNIDKFEPLLDEMAIKYGHRLVVSVEWRMVMMIGTTVLTVHAANNGMHWPSKIAAASDKVKREVDSGKFSGI